MAVLTNLANIKHIAQDDDHIQSLVDDNEEILVNVVYPLVDKMVRESRFGGLTESAQTYLAAHILSLAATDSGGRGPLSSESIGDISVSYTLPYLNQTSVLASTQYGLMFLELQRKVITPVYVI